jgi:hypothetical protein
MFDVEKVRKVADAFRNPPDCYEPDLDTVADLLDEAVAAVEHYRDQTARFAFDADKSGYHPWVVTDDSTGRQVLVSIFTDEGGGIDVVQIAYRDNAWDSWSPPASGVKG